MKHFIVLAAFLSCAWAFGTAAVYERLFYYYAYRVDVAINGAPPSTISVGCGKTMRIGAKKTCSFNQWIEFVYKGDPSPSTNFQVTSDDIPNIDKVAKLSEDDTDRGLKTTYNCDKIMNGVGPNNVAGLFDKVSKFVSQNINKVEDATLQDTLRKNLYSAMSSAARQRTAEGVEAARGSLAAEGIDIKTHQVPMFDGAEADNTVEEIDVKATVDANQGKTKKEIISALQTWKAEYEKNEPGHSNNIKNSKQAAKRLSAGCI